MTADDADGELCVLLVCGAQLFALPAGGVDRLALPGGVQLERDPEAPLGPGALGVVWVDGAPSAAWDLGVLLGLEASTDAWVLLRVDWRGSVLPLALRTGRCLAVRRLSDARPLPPGAFATRLGAAARAFDARALLPSAPTTVGLRVDVDPFFHADELDASARLLRTCGWNDDAA